MKKRLLFHTIGMGLLALRIVSGAEEQTPFIVENLSPGRGEVIFYYDTGLAVGTNGVRVTYGDAVLTADRVSLNEKTGEVTAEGNVILKQEAQVWRGERLYYNFVTRQIEAANFRTGDGRFFAMGEGLSANLTNQTYSATNAVVTTDDIADPSYRIKAGRLKLLPGQTVEARDATLYLGSVPVMYFPYYQRRLTRHPNNWVITPGYRSLYGPYFLSEYNWIWSEQLSGAINLDYRQKRGVGAGPDFSYDLGRWGEGKLRTYYTHDQRPGQDVSGASISEDRHRISFSHQATIRTNLSAKLVVREQSDPRIIRDFYESEYRLDLQPKSLFEVDQLWPNYSLNVLAQAQVNDFFETVERLPDVKLSAFRQQLGVSPFFYEGENSVGYFRLRDGWMAGTNYAAWRGDSFHQLVLPLTGWGWLNVTPRVGGRLTHYTESEGAGVTWSEETRAVFNTGIETTFKASRVWRGAASRFWEVDGLRHIVEPGANYTFVPNPTERPRDLPQFDREIPSLRLLPIDYPDYNAIDSIDSQNVFRLSLRNKLQTKRDGLIDNVVNWALVTDWRLDPQPGQGTFADLFSDLDFRPRRWLTLNSEMRYDVDDGAWRLASHAVTVEPGEVWSVSFGHRYFQSESDLRPESDNNLFFTRLYYRFNENWGARISHHFEARDGIMEEQYYTVYRDFRSWTSALTFRVRQSRVGEDDFTVAVTFSLKARPRFKLDHDKEHPSLLLGS